MRLGKKSLSLIATWLAVVALTLTLAHHFAMTTTFIAAFITANIIVAGIVIGLKFKTRNSTQQIINQLAEINSTESITKRIHLHSRSHELNLIANGINAILNSAEKMQERREEELNKRLHDLEKHNQELKDELAQLTPIAGKPIEKIDLLDLIAHMKNYDEFPSRVYFNQILSKSILHAERHKNTLAILLVDINEFKNINKNLGADAAKNLLIELSKRLEKTLRSEDVITKLENAEFIILLNKLDKPQFASIVAEKLLKALSQPFKLPNQEDYLPTANIGICTYPIDGHSLDELLNHLDTALYKAKARGENTYQFFNQETHDSAHDYIQMESALHHAIINNELVLYYQPKLNLKKGRVVSLEALLRWINPNLGTLYPAQFLNIADETGFYLPMAEWVIREACKMNKYWQDEGYSHITVSVNLSSKQFHHPEMPNIISRALEDHKLNPKYLEIELDEKTLMEDVNATSSTLLAISATGIRITVDHFGIGYTSISYLKKFPISTIKIDKSFINGIPNNPNDSAIVSAFIALSHQLGIIAVAEGVETAEQVQFLSEKNCDTIQGYFLSHPLPADKIKLQLSKLSEAVLI